MTPFNLFPFIAVAIICITFYVDVRSDFNRWDSGKINHIRGALLRLIGFIPATLLDFHSGLLWLPYWPLFDGWLGVWKKREDMRKDYPYGQFGWFYLGTTSTLDRMQYKYKWLVVVKYFLACAGVVAYLIFKF